MRVLWLCNIMLPAFAKSRGLPYSNREGWLTGCYERIVKGSECAENCSAENGEGVKLAVCFPADGELCDKRFDGDCTFYTFSEDLNTPWIYNSALEVRFKEIIDDFRPDIVHVFGTEFPHALSMVRAFGNPEHTLAGIQGLCCAIEEKYMADLPDSVIKRATFRDRIKKDSLILQKKKFALRSVNEEEAIKGVGNVTGRTCFDKTQTAGIHPGVNYYHMNETMRPDFYTGKWELSKAKNHRIFISQGDYPLKGFHYMLLAMPKILEKYPDTQLVVAGNSIIGNVGGVLKEKKKYPEPVWITSYGLYLKKLIRDNGLEGHVAMLGRLTGSEMKAQFLEAHVYVCPSILENSPNSLCEAMLLGLPCVASNVGGIPDLVRDDVTGLLFEGGNTLELARKVTELFDSDEKACLLGENARKEAMVRHDPDKNYKRLLEIYKAIAG